MAMVLATGFEIGPNATSSPDGTGGTRDTTTKRTGAASLAMAVGQSSNNAPGTIAGSPTKGWLRIYFQLTAFTAPASVQEFFYFGSGKIRVAWVGGGTKQLKLQRDSDGAGTYVDVGSASATLSDGRDYRLELYYLPSATVGECEIRLDGETLGSATGVAVGSNTTVTRTWAVMNRGSAGIINLDDLQINDDQGSANNSWIGDGHVLLMKPTADSQIGSWTGGAGGTSSLFDAVDNTPPVGTASETNTTQIESVDSSGNNATDEYRGDCGTYLAAGITEYDTIMGLSIHCCHGEDVATGTKTGSFGPQANPAASYATFTFGGDVGALGTYPTNWQWSQAQEAGLLVDSPTVTKGSSLILAVRKTDAGTRVASVCFLGAYVAVKPGYPLHLRQQQPPRPQPPRPPVRHARGI